MIIEEVLDPLNIDSGGLTKYDTERTGKMIWYSKDGIKWGYGSEAPYRVGVHKAAKSLGIEDGQLIYSKDKVYSLKAPYKKKK